MTRRGIHHTLLNTSQRTKPTFTGKLQMPWLMAPESRSGMGNRCGGSVFWGFLQGFSPAECGVVDGCGKPMLSLGKWSTKSAFFSTKKMFVYPRALDIRQGFAHRNYQCCYPVNEIKWSQNQWEKRRQELAFTNRNGKNDVISDR